MLALNAMVACPEILVPVRLALASLPGLKDLQDTIAVLQDSEPDVRILGVVGTYFRERTNGPGETLEHIRQGFGEHAFDTVIHHAQGIEDACGRGCPICLSEPGSRAGAEYLQLTEEVISRCQKAEVRGQGLQPSRPAPDSARSVLPSNRRQTEVSNG